jgi:hypothetical protein
MGSGVSSTAAAIAQREQEILNAAQAKDQAEKDSLLTSSSMRSMLKIEDLAKAHYLRKVKSECIPLLRSIAATEGSLVLRRIAATEDLEDDPSWMQVDTPRSQICGDDEEPVRIRPKLSVSFAQEEELKRQSAVQAAATEKSGELDDHAKATSKKKKKTKKTKKKKPEKLVTQEEVPAKKGKSRFRKWLGRRDLRVVVSDEVDEELEEEANARPKDDAHVEFTKVGLRS